MDIIGLVDRITAAATNIDTGRKGFAVRGKEQQGRISYETGIEWAFSAFRDAQSTGDPNIIILAEFSFLTIELQLCDKEKKDSINSLTQAVQSFDDAFLVLSVVEDGTSYKVADKCFPHHKKHRIKGYPKDSFHIACESHKTRLKNILRFSGIEAIEDTLLKQRLANLSTAQNAYIEKQKKAMDGK
ncbi:MAG: hypothetical protein LBU83_07045 [Bacteroidales bacterium]|nr:hypothetical protein [Bacteroidales bacterium]